MLIQADNIWRGYQSGAARLDALKDCSFTIEDGDFVAITGPSGSGKTTLMNILGLLDRPSGGVLRVDGQNTGKLSANARARLRNTGFGFVFQSYNLLPRLTALENIELPMIYAGVAAAARRARALALLEETGLQDRMAHFPHQLSGGEQQRIAIARALANRPRMLLADEPTGALDSRKGRQILASFQRINAAGQTVAMITHDETVAQHAKRVLRMKDGRITADMPVQNRILQEAVPGPP